MGPLHGAARRLRFESASSGVFAIVVLGAMGGCSDTGAGAPRSERVETVRSALTGGDTTDVSSATTLPEAAVGHLLVTAGVIGNCSGTLILRNVVLSAAHCFVLSGGTGFVPEGTPGNPVGTFVLPQIVPATTFSFQSFAANIRNIHAVNPGIFGNAEGDEDTDLAVAFLDAPGVSTSQLADLPEVYFGSDFPDRVVNILEPNPSVAFFGSPIRVVGFAGTNTRKAATIHNVNFREDCGPFGGSCSGDLIVVNVDDNDPLGQPGDSGGSISFLQNGTTPTVFGVAGGVSQLPLQPKHDVFSPTWDNGRGNGTWLMQFIPDADHDGVLDNVDNCAPAKFCPDNPDRCANPDQRDDDHDGIGDVCDNCPASACTQRGWDVSICANPGQEDGDNDHVGDVCDNCPDKPNRFGQLSDIDQDGVGDACDNCDQPNGYIACASDADCGSAHCLSAGAAGALGLFGTCAFGANIGRACGSSGECPGAFCSTTFVGRCSHQLDGALSGIGLPCDSCNNVSTDTRVLANSNAEDELREDVSPLGDRCDPVPTTVSRFFPSAVSGFQFLTSTDGVGTDKGTALRAQGSAGYRYCSCVDPATNTQVSRADCLVRLCRPTRDAIAGGAGEWNSISLSAVAGFQAPLSVPAPSLNLQTSGTYTSDILCNDFAHPGAVTETCRVGATQRTLVWSSGQDVSSGRVGVDRFGNPGGILLSHVLQAVTPAGATFTSARDQGTGGNLRSNYEYFGVNPAFVLPPRIAIIDCGRFGCAPIWRWDWLVDPIPFRVNPGPLRQAQFLGRILPAAGGGFGILGNPTDPTYDVTASLSAGVRAILGSSGLAFLSPAEPGSSGIQSGLSVAFAAVPTQWRQSALRPLVALSSGGFLQTAFETEVRAAAPLSLARFVPGDRDSARAILSGTARSVYLVGGHPLSGELPGEVWQYDIFSDTWTHLFLPKDGEPRPGDVEAIALDEGAQRILVLDTAHGRDGRPATRLLQLDLRSQSTRILTTVPGVDNTLTSALVAVGDGSFFLVQQRAGSADWKAQRFDLAPTAGVECKGHTHGQGVLASDPILTTNGVFLPLLGDDTAGISAPERQDQFFPLSLSKLDPDDPNCLFASSLPPVALYATAGITLGEDSSVVSPSGGFSALDNAGGTVRLGEAATCGDILSLGPITLDERATVHGGAFSTGAITLEHGSEVTGSDSPFASVVVPPLPSLNITFPSGVRDVHVGGGQVQTLRPGGYGNVTVKSNGRLKLSAGVYTFKSLELEPQGRLDLDHAEGAITIDIENSIVFRGKVTRSSSDSAQFLLAYAGARKTLLEEGFVGSFFGPNADLTLGANSPTVFTGQYVAKTVRTRPHTEVVF